MTWLQAPCQPSSTAPAAPSWHSGCASTSAPLVATAWMSAQRWEASLCTFVSTFQYTHKHFKSYIYILYLHGEARNSIGCHLHTRIHMCMCISIWPKRRAVNWNKQFESANLTKKLFATASSVVAVANALPGVSPELLPIPLPWQQVHALTPILWTTYPLTHSLVNSDLHYLQNIDPQISFNHQTIPPLYPEVQTSYTTWSGSSRGS